MVINKKGQTMNLEVALWNVVDAKTDAILNYANYFLKRGGGVCDAIFEKAGAEELEKECKEICQFNIKSNANWCGCRKDNHEIFKLKDELGGCCDRKMHLPTDRMLICLDKL